jgi:hypothetical protein
MHLNMKNLLLFTILIGTMITASCSNNKKRIADESEIQNPTPEVLDNNRDLKAASISRSYRADIIQELYQEAINKNDKLKKLSNRINEIDGIKADSLELYNKFIQTNRNYYATADDYINQLSDSTIKNELKEIFKIIENKYKVRVSKIVSAVEKIDSKTKFLNDQVILMKLLITEPMISNYQINESPNIETINNLGKIYDSLIKDVKPYTLINK